MSETIVAVIIGGLIASLVPLLNSVASLIADRQKWSRAQKAIEREKFDDASKELLGLFSYKITGHYDSRNTIRDDIGVSFNNWQLLAYLRLNKDQRNQVEDIRKKYAATGWRMNSTEVREISEELLVLIHAVQDKLF